MPFADIGNVPIVILVVLILSAPFIGTVILAFTVEIERPGKVALISLACAVVSFLAPIVFKLAGLLDGSEYGFIFMIIICWMVSAVSVLASVLYAIKAYWRARGHQN